MSERSMQKVRQDFDRIAPFETERWNRNNHYHDFLLENLPAQCPRALEIGCGIGTFTRLLAERAESVTALDLSPQMIRTAENLSRTRANVDFRIGDVLEIDFPDAYFDAVVSIATFHHLPLEKVLPKLKKTLKIGGRLLVLDVSRVETVGDLCVGALAAPLASVLGILRNGFARPSREEREAWKRHAKTDRLLSFAEAKRIFPAYLENASVRRHFFFRYSVVWEKKS